MAYRDEIPIAPRMGTAPSRRSMPRLVCCVLCVLIVLTFNACKQTDAPACVISAEIPPDVPETDQTQPWFDFFSWASFTAITQATVNGQGQPLWMNWSSTADYLNLTAVNGGTPPPFGKRFYPEACRQIEGYENYRAIEQVGKVADSIFEASATGLSDSPVVDANGYFVRYEIVINQDMYNFVTSNQYYKASNISNGTDQAHVNGTCGQIDGAEGVMNVKLAWMVINPTPDSGPSTDLWPRGNYITEELLIFDGAGTTSTSEPTCQKMLMGLVGMHIAHKTESQPDWVWSTFEHDNNAPDCGAWPSTGGVNTSCPASVDQNWNFYGEECNSGSGCQTCNATPAKNGGTKWHADQQPVTVDQGRSRLCRQVPVTADGAYSSAYAQNEACQQALGTSVAANYELISTQWFDWTTAGQASPPITKPDGCTDVAGLFDSILKGGNAGTMRQYIEPQVPNTTNTTNRSVPFLANTSMESYERSNCMGCHAKGALTNPNCVTAGADNCKAENWEGTEENGKQGFLPIQGSGSETGGCGTAKGVPCAPTDAYNFTDFSWWFAVEVPVDGVQ